MRRGCAKTTLLGLLKHVTYVEGVWFDQAISGRASARPSCGASPTSRATEDEARRRLAAPATSSSTVRRLTTAPMCFDAIVDGRGDHAVWALHLQVLRELAQHAGHVDILREQIMARRAQ